MNIIESIVSLHVVDRESLRGGDAILAPHTFSAGEAHVNVLDAGAIANETFVVSVQGGSLGALAEALVYADALRRSDAAAVHLFIPYLPAARQDRGAPFTAQIAADMINLGEFDSVIAADSHSPVMPSLIRNYREITATHLVPEQLFDGGDITVIAPDAGARDRAQAVAGRFGVPVVQASKRRDPARNYAVAAYDCPPITTSRAIVIDDICDGGGTFLALATALEMPAGSLALWTTHGIYANTAAPLKEHYGTLACSDSLPTSNAADVVAPLEATLVNLITTHEGDPS